MCSHGSEMTEQPVCFVAYSASDFAGSAISIFMPFVGEVEGEHGGFELGMPQVALDEPGIHAGFA